MFDTKGAIVNLASGHTTENEFGELETNDLVIRGYTSIGNLHGLGRVEIEAREAVIPDRRHVAYFVRVGVESGDEYPQSGVAMIAYDNVAKLLTALEKLSGIVIKTDRFAFSEIEYDVDGLKVIVFNNERGKVMFALIAGNVSVHFNSIGQLEEFRGLVFRAKQHLDRIKMEF